MTAETGQRVGDKTWVWSVSSKRTARYAMVAAAIIFAVHVVLAFTLVDAGSGTGVYFRPVDQLAMLAIGGCLSGAVLLLARSRLRVGPQGVGVRNAFMEKVIPWSRVNGLFFVEGASWARIELPDDEYTPVLAIQTNDGEHAARAAETFREYMARYTAS
ncbi:PH domain-containing protein [Millisia brevis]|uniref:PH domain-containing protein n=1 Tax=Millisia brevis TaxID=264148 RepID=UPI000835C8B0|nr:PH domain-containing protein [Millisia brevis]